MNNKIQMTLQAIPSGKLQFNGPYNVVSTAILTLTNTENERLTFSIKTTVPRWYCAAPSKGILDGNEKKKICLEDGNNFVSSYVKSNPVDQIVDHSKDKFMVHVLIGERELGKSNGFNDALSHSISRSAAIMLDYFNETSIFK